ncbi:hypothetical protein L218DRAFT_1008657 [Marasmius fiardii PR-910]|nr:hypothetical protein L218DRAFT_1008657 [Marasmius fiardii PR-910]
MARLFPLIVGFFGFFIAATHAAVTCPIDKIKVGFANLQQGLNLYHTEVLAIHPAWTYMAPEDHERFEQHVTQTRGYMWDVLHEVAMCRNPYTKADYQTLRKLWVAANTHVTAINKDINHKKPGVANQLRIAGMNPWAASLNTMKSVLDGMPKAGKVKG